MAEEHCSNALYGLILYKQLNLNFSTYGKVSMEFIEMSPEALYIKIETIDDKKLYSFTYNYHNRIRTKFEIDPNFEYYVYESDIEKFNQMSAEKQIEYLNGIKYNDLVIGIIESNEIQLLLYSMLKLNTKYTGIVQESNFINNIFWWNIKVKNLTININTHRLITNYKSLKMKNYTTKVRSQTYVSWSDKIYNMLEPLNSEYLQIQDERIDYDKNKNNLNRKIIITATKLKEDQKIPLFIIAIKTDLIGNKLKDIAYIIPNGFLENITPEAGRYKGKEACSTLDRIKDYFLNMSDELAKRPNKELRNIAKVLAKLN